MIDAPTQRNATFYQRDAHLDVKQLHSALGVIRPKGPRDKKKSIFGTENPTRGEFPIFEEQGLLIEEALTKVPLLYVSFMADYSLVGRIRLKLK